LPWLRADIGIIGWRGYLRGFEVDGRRRPLCPTLFGRLRGVFGLVFVHSHRFLFRCQPNPANEYAAQ
jgi:hypothetical protein